MAVAPTYEKHYVEVVSKTDVEGRVMPLVVVWDDGRRFEVARVLEVRQARAAKTGGAGLRFTIAVGGRHTHVFYVNPRWFVEARARGAPGQPPPPYGDTMTLGLK